MASMGYASYFRTVLGLVGGVRAVGAAARTSVAGHLSPPAGESCGAGRGHFELSIMGFGAGLRPEGGL